MGFQCFLHQHLYQFQGHQHHPNLCQLLVIYHQSPTNELWIQTEDFFHLLCPLPVCAQNYDLGSVSFGQVHFTNFQGLHQIQDKYPNCFLPK